MNALLKERTRDGPRCSVDVQILMRTCLEEFLQMLTTQASEVSAKAGKKTICKDHIDAALEQLDGAELCGRRIRLDYTE